MAISRFFALLLLAASPALAASAANSDPVLGTINGGEIHAADVKALLDGLDPATRRAATANLESLTEFVRRYALQRAVVAEAEAKSWASGPAAQAFLKRAHDEAEATGYLAGLSKPPADYPSEAEVKAAFEKNRDRFVRAGQYELQALTFSVTAADKVKADRIEKFVNDNVRKAKTDQDFETIARSKPADLDVSYRNLGFLAANQLAPELRGTISSMRIGDISPMLRLPDAVEILRVRDIKGPQPLQYDEVRPQLVDAMIHDKSNELESNELKRIQQASPIAINQIAVQQLLDGE